MGFAKRLTLILAAIGLLGTPAMADVIVKFSPRLQDNLSRIDRIEKQREIYFRDHREEGVGLAAARSLNTSRFSKTEFGNERVIPDVENFSVTALVEAMAEHDLSAVSGWSKEHTLVVEIDEFYASDYSLAAFRSFNTRMKGRLSVQDASGAVVASADVATALVPQWSVDWSYTGSEYAYLAQSQHVRFGPMLAYFLKRGIEKLYPDADVPGPIFLRRR